MKIKKVEIINFKSIKDIIVPFQNYGTNSHSSKTCILVGLNETGKTSILKALNLIDKNCEDLDYSEDCFKDSIDNDEHIELVVDFDLPISNWWATKLEEVCKIPIEIAKQISFKCLQKNIYMKSNNHGSEYIIELNDIDLFEYLIEDGDINKIAEINNVQEKITAKNATSFLSEHQTLLTRQQLERLIEDNFSGYFDANIPKVQIWRPQKEYLINTPVDLNAFKDNNSVSLPLKNIFHISGYKNADSIKSIIERALDKQEISDELKDKLSSSTTKHINKIWKEHKIKVVVSINGSNCQVFIEDKDKKHKYYRMEQRSDGFQQFASLILSLSAQNESSNLKNKIILIDEPEVHLHPSGVRHMRDEILRIGKLNHVFVSTHSHYMVDTNCDERHWIVKKEKAETTIHQIGEGVTIEDDDVLVSAFGLNLFKELLPEHILVVEGGDDKAVLQHGLSSLGTELKYSIKSAGGASKSPGIATLLVNENVKAHFLFDDDKEGRNNRKKILDNHKLNFNEENVFTLRSIVNSLPADATLEDVFPTSFVKSFFERELSSSFTIDESKSVINQLKRQNDAIAKDKQKLDSLKIKLSKEFISTYDTKTKISSKAPLFKELVEKIILKWNP